MRRIKIVKWKEKTDNGEVEQSTISALNMLVLQQKAENLPKGIEGFRVFGRIAKAFDDSEKTGFLNLEETEYNFLKKIIEKDIPSVWGTNKDILEAINSFIEAKEE